MIMSDFAIARRHLVFIFRVKLGHWRSLPWHMFGIAHPDEDKARACMQRCLQLYEDPATRSNHGVNDALDDKVWVDLTKGIFIAGLLHIIHKATDGL